jgi:hypothetical protein
MGSSSRSLSISLWVATNCEQSLSSPLSITPHCDSRSQIITLTTFAPLLSKTLPLAAFSRHQLIKTVLGIVTITALILCIPKFFSESECWIAFLLLLPSFPLLHVTTISQCWMRKWYQVPLSCFLCLTPPFPSAVLRTLRSIISHKSSSRSALRSFGRSFAIRSRLSSTTTRSISPLPRNASAPLRSTPSPRLSSSTSLPSSSLNPALLPSLSLPHRY